MSDFTLAAIVAASGLLSLKLMSRASRARAYAIMLLINALIAVFALVSTGAERKMASFLAMAGALLLLVVPMMLRAAVTWGLRTHRLGMARWLASLREYLQPGMGGREQAAYIEQVQAADRGDVTPIIEKLRLLREHTNDPNVQSAIDERVLATLIAAREWQQAIEHYETRMQSAQVSPQATAALVRPYCEVGQMSRALDVLQRVESAAWAKEPVYAMVVDMARLVVLAYAGRQRSVRHLLEHRILAASLQRFDREYWLGVVELHAGETDAARDHWQRAARLSRGGAKLRVEEKLARIKDIQPLQVEPDEASVLTSVESEVFATETPMPPRAHHGTTLAIVSIAVAAIATTVAFGSTVDQGALFLAGGNVGPAVMLGDYFRLVTAMFLHLGWLHLLFNALGLWVLGRYVEREIGASRVLLLLLLSGIVGNVASAFLGPTALAVGASGAVMGLFGYLAVYLLRNWASVSTQWRRIFIVIAGLELLLGFFHPLIDQYAHVGGFFAGAFCALVGIARIPRRAALAAVIAVVAFGLVGRALWSTESLAESAGSKLVETDGVSAQVPAYWASSDRDKWGLVDFHLRRVARVTEAELFEQAKADLASEHGKRYHLEAKETYGNWHGLHASWTTGTEDQTRYQTAIWARSTPSGLTTVVIHQPLLVADYQRQVLRRVLDSVSVSATSGAVR